MGKHFELLNDAEVKKAIRVLVAKGITLREVEEAYRYYDRIKNNHEKVDVCKLLF
ncbi:hypothetical protein H7B90_23710 [Cohnella xylanilytica]|uniref:Uncharacterized protein n=1 Tax=Cohnella xylanilytica TaxID=557555 RepID=A0A841U5Q8_9BACL|nr:hypothetical protein [Cohnella xylanilytica]MBB6694408.1 hypothetical protein [Cohnella xylanilytica]